MATKANQACRNIFESEVTMGQDPGCLKEWLEKKCQSEHLSLRKTGIKVGLSHATIADIINGGRPSVETIKKLAEAFGGNGQRQRLALEDQLFALCGYRSERPEEIREPVARLMDKLSQFNDAQLRVMEHFADFISEKGEKS